MYSSHFIEHLFKKEAEKLLNDAFRVLKKGGRIRITVPNLECAFKLYENGKKEKALKMFFDEGKKSEFSYHRYLYDFELLSNLLSECGFIEIKRCEFQQGKVPDIDILDNRSKYTLFVEAVK
ncbi:hypothetical protein JCM15415_21060 [Methanobacterium movens]